MNCDRTDCIHYKVCEEWKSLSNDNYINDSYGNCDNYSPTNYTTTGDLTEAEKKICKMYLEDLDKTHTCNEYKLLMGLIDNASAVKHSLLPLAGDCDEAYMRGYEIGKAEGILKAHTRHKGEWLYNDKLNMYYCKDCGLLEPFTKEDVEEGFKLPNFCEQCGADMRKATQNEN